MSDLYSALHPNAKIPPSVPSEYPKWVHSVGGSVLVHSASEESELTGKEISEPQTCETVNALFPQSQVLDTPDLGERALLQLEASNMGIEVDRRWGVRKLRQMIEAHR